MVRLNRHLLKAALCTCEKRGDVVGRASISICHTRNGKIPSAIDFGIAFVFSLLTLRGFSVSFLLGISPVLSLHSCTHSVSCQDTSTFICVKCICYTFPVIVFGSESDHCLCFSVTGMPKEKYDPPDPRRMYTIMSSEEAANGKKSYWAELEIVGNVGVLSGGQHVKDKFKIDPVYLV